MALPAPPIAFIKRELKKLQRKPLTPEIQKKIEALQKQIQQHQKR